MNTENGNTNQSHRFRLTSADKLNLKDTNKDMSLTDLSIYYTWKNIKSAFKNRNYKIYAPTQNDEFDLPEGSYFVSGIQDYFEYIIENRKTIANNTPVQIYVNKIKNRVIFKIKLGYKLELLSLETIKLLGSTKNDVDQDKDGENVLKLEPIEDFLVPRSLVNNNYCQQASKILFTFVPKKEFGQLMNISPHSLTMLNATNTKFSLIEVWFTDQNSKKLEIEDNVNMTLIIGQILWMRYSIETKKQKVC